MRTLPNRRMNSDRADNMIGLWSRGAGAEYERLATSRTAEHRRAMAKAGRRHSAPPYVRERYEDAKFPRTITTHASASVATP